MQVPATEKGSPGRYRRGKFKIMGPFSHWKLGAFCSDEIRRFSKTHIICIYVCT